MALHQHYLVLTVQVINLLNKYADSMEFLAPTLLKLTSSDPHPRQTPLRPPARLPSESRVHAVSEGLSQAYSLFMHNFRLD